jgi:hypothetical protein
MASSNVLPSLVRLAVVIMVPTMACFGYYTLDALDDRRSAWAIPAVLAYPAALIGLVGLVSTLRAARPTRTRLALWALCVVAPVVLLLWLRS